MTNSLAILFAIPVNKEEFDQVVARTPRSDYLTGMLLSASPEQIWASDYQSISRAALALISTAHKLGVAVYQRATLHDFSVATSNFSTIILFTHWRGAIVRPTDFLVGFPAVNAQMSRSPALQHVRIVVSEIAAVVTALNAEIESLNSLNVLPKSLADAGRRTKSIGQTLCRDLIDESLLGMIVPGNRVEFFDGLYTPAQVEAALSAGFSGQIDFALCNSAALATFIDLRRHNAVRHLHWPTVIDPRPQLIKVEKTLNLMNEYGGDYAKTRLFVEESE